jgi:hypothetical protein
MHMDTHRCITGVETRVIRMANEPTHNSLFEERPSAHKIYKAFTAVASQLSPSPLPPRPKDRALLSPTLAPQVTARQTAGRPETSLPREILAHRRFAAFPAPHPNLQHDSGQGAMYIYTHTYIYMYTHTHNVYMYIDVYRKRARMVTIGADKSSSAGEGDSKEQR